MSFNPEQALQLARETLDIEAAALLGLKSRLDSRFTQAVQMMLNVKGRVVVTGMGKSGHIGSKIAATLASTGTPAMFVHPGEASHGDLGMIKAVDVVLAISNSGESDELVSILPVLKRQGVPLIAMTGGMDSALAMHADVVLDSSVEKEAGCTWLQGRRFCTLAPRWFFGSSFVDPCQRRDAQRRSSAARIGQRQLL
ncbi:MAG: Arabinose 5-phosphate isomerase KdsD [Pseudomonadota bacterium]